MSAPDGNQRPPVDWTIRAAGWLRFMQHNALIVVSIVLLAISAVFYVKAEAYRANRDLTKSQQPADNAEESE